MNRGKSASLSSTIARACLSFEVARLNTALAKSLDLLMTSRDGKTAGISLNAFLLISMNAEQFAHPLMESM